MAADEALETNLATFRELLPMVRRQLLADISRLSMDLPDLYASMVSQQGE